MSDFGEIDDEVLQNIEHLRIPTKKQSALPKNNFQ
jgi:hypothetical protein